MSIYLGDTKVSGNAKELAFPLFTPIFQDHIVNNTSWLRSDTFSWQSGAVYVAAYNHLVADISGITAETETIASTTITFKRATDGHKIVDETQISNIESIFNATGIAWYYVLDTTNQRFKLPRTKWGFKGFRDEVGGFLPQTLPNITGTLGAGSCTFHSGSGAFTLSGTSNPNGGSVQQFAGFATFDASNSSTIYQNGANVREYSTQMYLYFYVGNTVQNETSVNVAQLAEGLNGKADIDLGNLSNSGEQVIVNNIIPDYANGVTVSAIPMGTYTQVTKDSIVVTYGLDGYTENYWVYVSPDNGTTTYIVGNRYDDTNGQTESVTFTFFVPKGWYFTNNAEGGYNAHIYPLKGAQ